VEEEISRPRKAWRLYSNAHRGFGKDLKVSRRWTGDNHEKEVIGGRVVSELV